MFRRTDVVVGIDIGTSSTKILLVDAAGVVVHVGRAVSRSTDDGWREQDAEYAWWQVTVDLLSRTLAEVDVNVLAVGVTGGGPNLVPVGQDGHCLGPAITYADDCATSEIAALEAEYGAEAIVEMCGHALNAESVGPKLLWLQQYRSEEWERAAELHTSHTLVVRRLGGDYVLDHTSASLWDPIYDPWRNEWIEPMVERFGVARILPRLAWASELVGRVSAPASVLTGLPSGIPIVAGAIDFAAEQVGVGATERGQATIVYGSTMVAQVMSDEVLAGRDAYSTVGPFPGSHLVGGVTGTAGTLLSWCSEILGVGNVEELLARASYSPAGARGLLVLPYFAGERSPIWDPRARGAIFGLTLQHRDADIARSVVEATALALRHVLDTLREGGVDVNSAICTGGGADSLWAQIVSDCTGISQTVARTTAAAALGVALLAAKASGFVSEESDWTENGRTVQPCQMAKGVFDSLYPLYREAYPANMQMIHALVDAS